ncbi:gas vesicle protein GvpG [Kribbella shirazensis]|uniref:Chorismate mutase n=1 Tax=Kribbella shirazensis TaxID=1105143 RepID=A0A7X6A519_9ACTN|nr:gas vesicle protein GvpG [Kribbella shirazensis]NIK61610.1 chorismate mutase [Kribbella shirazensis]
MTNLLTLPLAPVRMTIALAEQIRRQAESEYYDPARIRLQLEQVEALREAGAIDPDEAVAFEDELLARLLAANERQRWEA